MKRMLALNLALMLLIGAGCGDSHESLAAENLSTMKEMVSVLEGVKDEATATSAKPALKALIEKMNNLNARIVKLPAPTPDQAKDLQARYGKDMEAIAQKLQANMMRLTVDPKIAPILMSIEQDMKKPAG